MKKMELSRIVLFLILGLVLTAALIAPVVVMAQGPAAETPTPEPGKPTATEFPTPTSTSTPDAATATVSPTRTPGPTEPVSIPEPITVILFGTGLAALSASAAVRRKKE